MITKTACLAKSEVSRNPRRCRSLLAGSAIGLILAATALQPMLAQAATIDIDAPGDISGAIGTIADGDIWNLTTAGAFLSNILALPTGVAGLKISGNDNTLTLSSGTSSGGLTFTADTALSLADITVNIGARTFADSQGSNVNLTLNTSGVVFEGGNGGGTIAGASSITVNGDLTMRDIGAGSSAISSGETDITVTGATTATHNNSGVRTGSAFYSSRGVALQGNAELSGHSVRGDLDAHGGAIMAHGDVTIGTSSHAVTAVLSNNSVRSSRLASGGAIHTSTSGDVTIYGSASLTGNSAQSDGNGSASGGAIRVGYRHNVLITQDATIKGNSATAVIGDVSGGAIDAFRGIVALQGNTALIGNGITNDGGISGNIITGALGGAIFADGVVIGTSSRAVTTTISNNTALSRQGYAHGGGIAVFGKNATIYGSATITDNSATSNFDDALGGARASILNDTLGGAIYAGSGIEITQTAMISGNTVTAGGVGAASGGALYANQVFLHGDTTLKGNSATGFDQAFGGAILSLGAVTIGTPTASAIATITDNSVSGHYSVGGAIFAEGNLTIYGSAIIERNSATSDRNGKTTGGALHSGNLGNLMITQDATIKDNTITTSEAGYAQGGAIFAFQDVALQGNTTLAGNRATGGIVSGGAVFSETGTVTIGTSLSPVAAIFSTNAVLAQSGTALGGAISAYQTVTIHGSANVTDNSATSSASHARGGAIYSETGGITITQAATFTGNKVTAGADGYAEGGALYATENVALQDNATLTGNSATSATGAASGGAISTRGSVTIGTASNSVTAILSNNSVRGGAQADGGAIRSYETVTIYGSANISGNSVTATAGPALGGAIYASNGKSFNRSNINFRQDATLNGNSATATAGSGASGGALNSSGYVHFGGSATLNNNTATHSGSGRSEGGAIFADSGGSPYTGVAVNFRADATLNGNTAGTDGGAIWATSDAWFEGAASLDGNKAIAGDGGAINAYGTTLRGRATFTNNTAGGNGGAFYGAVFAAEGGGKFSGNISARNGGAIYADEAVTVATGIGGGNTLFSDNVSTSGLGGAIYLYSDYRVYLASVGVSTSVGRLTLNATTGNITFSGNRHSPGLGAIGGCGLVASCANAIYFNNISGTTATFHATAGNAITFYDPIASNTRKGLMTVLKTGDGLLSFDGSRYSAVSDWQSTILANTHVQGGTFEIANNAVYGILGAGSGVMTSFTTDQGTMLQGGKFGGLVANSITLNGNLSIAGRAPSASGYSTFTISARDITFGGGRVLFNAALGDGSAQQSDRLVLDLMGGGVVNGTAQIYVTNTGGPGGPTAGNSGLLIVKMENGTTTDSTFRLGAPVIAGAYQYDLAHAADGNWYLTSTVMPSSPANPPNPSNPSGPSNPSRPASVAAAPVDRIQPGVPTHAAVMPLATEYGYALLSNLHERAGDTAVTPLLPVYEDQVVRCPNGRGRCTARVTVTRKDAEGERWASSGWARLIGTQGFHEPDNFAQRGPNYNYTVGGIQAGLDIFGREGADGSLDKAGIYAAYGQITSTVKGQFGDKAGSVDMDAYTVGGYWTHKAPEGWYADAVVQGTWYATTATTVLGQKTTPDGFGVLGSLEGGYTFKFGDGFTFEPQAQIVYQSVSFDDVSDSYNVGYRFSDGESLRGRLGARMTKSWAMTDGAQPRLVTAWLRANLWHEFMGEAQVTAGDIRNWNAGSFIMPSSLGGTWGELGVGVSAQVSDKINLFASGAYQRSLDNKGRESWDGRLGMTMKW